MTSGVVTSEASTTWSWRGYSPSFTTAIAAGFSLERLSGTILLRGRRPHAVQDTPPAVKGRLVAQHQDSGSRHVRPPL